jgi:(1->4)-alpha-D-glucan 1-alpha-D-glucosylmutase
VEDTALYDDVAFVARDDVGSSPGAPPGGPEEFHRLAHLRAKRWRHGLSATSTHDSKRSEDVRARIAVLSEVPDRWRRSVNRWAKLVGPLKQPVDGEPVPDPSEELLLYQTLVGVTPIGPDEGGDLPERLTEFARKAARETKAHTSWTDPDEKHEEALAGFIGSLFGSEGEELRSQIGAFADKLGRAGATNSLAQLVWKIASPGVPDLYQGTERWSPTLVDPDNRGAVDFRAAQVTIASLPDPAGGPTAVRALLRSYRDGAIKLHVVRSGLGLRRDAPELFARGSYSPVRARGKRAAHVLAFARRLGKQWAVAAAPRLTASFGTSGFPVGRTWDGTSLVLPSGAPLAWRDVLTGERRRAKSGVLPAREVFASLPIAFLVPDGWNG